MFGTCERSAGERTASFGTVQPAHTCSSDHVPAQLYQRSGPAPPLHAVFCVCVQVSVDSTTVFTVTFGWSFWYFAIVCFIHASMPGTSWLPSHQRVSVILPPLLTSYWLPSPPPAVRVAAAVLTKASAAAATTAMDHLMAYLLRRWNRSERTVDRVDGAGDVGRVVGAEEDDELADLR